MMLIPQEGIHCERELDNQKKKKKKKKAVCSAFPLKSQIW